MTNYKYNYDNYKYFWGKKILISICGPRGAEAHSNELIILISPLW